MRDLISFVKRLNPYKTSFLFAIFFVFVAVVLVSASSKGADDLNSNGHAPVAQEMNHVVLDKNIPFAEQVTQPNTVYEIRYVFDLKRKDFSFPDNCVLNFTGGSLRNYSKLTFNRTYIDAAPYQIFYYDEMINKGDLEKCNGDFNSSLFAGRNGGILNDKMPIEWFGAIADSDVCSADAEERHFGTDCSSAIQYAINTSYNNRNTVYLTPTRHHYYVGSTIYLPSSFSIVGSNNAYELNSFGDSNSFASELFFSCKYLFRSKKNKGQSEQERLNNRIKANIDGIAIHGIYTAAPRAVSAHNSSVNKDIAAYNGDYYWEKKTYVFFGCILDGSSLCNLKVWGIGTFIYGAVRGLTKMTGNTIRYSRNLICGAAGIHNNHCWNTTHSFPLADGTKEVEFGSNSSYYLNGVKYNGYEEPIECYTSKSGAISSYDVTIENNYFTCPPTRCITFYEISPEQVTIKDNYIDFAFAVFAFQTQSELRVFHNTFDYCYMVLLSRAFDKISFVSNVVTRSTRRHICEGSKYVIAWWNNDYTPSKSYSTTGKTDGEGFSSTSHKPIAFVLYGDFNSGYIRNTKINDNTFADVQKFFNKNEGELRRSSDFTIQGNTFDADCDNSFSVKFTNGDAKGDEYSYEGEAKNIFVQQWAIINVDDQYSFPKYTQSPSHASRTWLAQNDNTIFHDLKNNNFYHLVGDVYVPINTIQSSSALLNENSVLQGQLPQGSSGLVYDQTTKRFGMVIGASSSKDGQVAVDGDGFKLMKKKHAGWVNTKEEGYQQYNTNLHKWGYYYNGSFVDFQGYHVASHSGPSSNRPTYSLTSSDIGFEYFDTDLNVPIFLTIINGVKSWTTSEGVNVTNVNALKGTMKERLSMWLNKDNEGLKFYDTSLKKWVLFNGAKWTNLDGSSL